MPKAALSAGSSSATRLLPRTRITARNIDKLVCGPGKGEQSFWDADVPGLAIRALASGKRTWIVQCRDPAGRSRKVKIGDARVVTIDAARARARELVFDIEKGGDPVEDKRKARQAVTVRAVIDEYLKREKPRLRPGSYDQKQRHLLVYSKGIHGERMEAVTRRQIGELLEGLAVSKVGGAGANRTRSSLGALWAWAIASGRIDLEANPVSLVPKPATEKSRERKLTETEFGAIWRATEGDSEHDRIVRLLMLTGARRDEVGGMKWSEIQGGWWAVPAPRMKSNREHRVWLTGEVLEQLPKPVDGRDHVFGSGDGFTNWSRSKAALDARSGVVGWTLHDLRRTMSSMLHDDGMIEPHVVELMLAHTVPGVAGIYNRAVMLEARKAAWERWGELVAAIVEPIRNDAKVVHLHRM
jgi:integrase